MKFTIIEDYRDNEIRSSNRIDVTFDEFSAFIENDYVVGSKEDGLFIIPVEFIDGDYIHRCADNVKSWTMLPLDFDGGITIAEAVEVYQQYNFVLYTTFNHLTDKYDGEDAFRMLIELDGSISKDDFQDRLSAIKSFTTAHNDKTSLYQSHGFYLPVYDASRLDDKVIIINNGIPLNLLKFKIDKKEVHKQIVDWEGDDEEKEQILDGLRDAHLGYKEWWRMIGNMKGLSWSVQDLLYVSAHNSNHDNSAGEMTNSLCESRWKATKTLEPNIGALINMIKENGDTNFKIKRKVENMLKIIKGTGNKTGVTKESLSDFKKMVQEKQDEYDAAHSIDWAKIKVTKGGIEYPTDRIENIEILLAHYNVTVRFNTMIHDIDIDIPDVAFNPETKANDFLTWMVDTAAEHNLNITTDKIDKIITLIAGKDQYHPVAEWIDGVEWDGVSRLEQFYDTIQVGKFTTPTMKKHLMRKWLIMGAAALFRKTGFTCQGVLLFTGKQGIGKTRWLESIVSNPEWVKDGVLLDPTNKDSIKGATNRWIVELGEIASTFKKADINALKAFITSPKDEFRLPYARKFNLYDRRTIYYGTVNNLDFLQDETGNRRFWTLDATSVDVNHSIDTQQLWAEAKSLWKGGAVYHLDQDEIAQLDRHNQSFSSIDPVIDLLNDNVVVDEVLVINSGKWLTPSTILRECGMSRVTRKDRSICVKWLENNEAQYKSYHNQYMVVINSTFYPT